MRTAHDHPAKNTGANRVTISDVSDALGLTKSTVSRALNDYPDIAEGTRLKVRRMAEKMGYNPLSFAQAIRTGLSRSVGLVIQMADHDAHRPFLAEFLAGVSQGASAHGWTLTLAAANDPAHTLETFSRMIRDRKVDGFIVPRTLVHDERIDLLREKQIPFVLFGRTADPRDCAWFDLLGEDAMQDAVRRLAHLGHRRIGFINGGLKYNYAALRQDGFLRGMRDAGLSVDDELLGDDAVTIAEGQAEATRMLMLDKPPTAFVCAVDMAALGVYRAAASFGLNMGSDVSTLSYDGIPDGAHATPQLSTYAVNFTQSGSTLSSLLIRRVLGEEPGNLRETQQADFLDRGSAGPPALSPDDIAARVAQHRS
ncbi:substrate-binding domain-containing protein [uncultured Roseobacter sp.]|uniref:substrate-binding domain-containing protein n=1 Tax=uncultured Roseobacter sp. TaxID=114847 RepID=UPI00262321E9|nr:substrate-binding domain-containing protein [uncultured Roseobacter sp.]